MAFEGKTDREVYLEAHRAAEELVRRFQQLLDLFPDRPNEREIADEKAELVRIAERSFREVYESLRDIRESLQEDR